MSYDNPKFGHPRSDAERRKRHKRIYGSKNLPKRGTGKGYLADALRNQGAK